MDFQIPLPGPPPFTQQPVRRRWYVVAYDRFRVGYDIARSLAPVSSSTNSTRFHVAPPSVVL
jgi:hypothetical protein